MKDAYGRTVPRRSIVVAVLVGVGIGVAGAALDLLWLAFVVLGLIVLGIVVNVARLKRRGSQPPASS